MEYKIRVRAERRETIDIDKLAAAVLRLARERAAAETMPKKRPTVSKKISTGTRRAS